jgi:hypothetical protein
MYARLNSSTSENIGGASTSQNNSQKGGTAIAMGVGTVLLYGGYTYFSWETQYKLHLYENKNHMFAIFDLLDKDQNGFIDKPEFKSFLERSGFQITNAMVDRIMNHFDPNGDGKLSKAEWIRLCESSPILNPKRSFVSEKKGS